MVTRGNLWGVWIFLLVAHWILGESMTRAEILGQLSLSAIWVMLVFVTGLLIATLNISRLTLPWIKRQPGSWKTFRIYRWLARFWLFLLFEGSVMFIINLFIGVSYSEDWLYPALHELITWGVYALAVMGVTIYICSSPRRASTIANSIKLTFLVLLIFLMLNPTRSLAAEVAVAGSAAVFLVRRTTLRWSLFIIALGVLAASGSRTATLAFIVGHILTYLSSLKITRPRTWYPLLISVVLIAMSTPFVLSASVGKRTAALIQVGLQAGLEGVLETQEGAYLTQGRSAVWPAILKHALQRATFGHGPGTASAYAFYVSQNSRFAHPHNEYLRIFHNYGLVGLLAFMNIYIIIILYAKLSASLKGNSSAQLWSNALMASTLASLSLFMTDNIGLYAFVISIHGTIVGASLCIGSLPCTATGISRQAKRG